MCLILDNFSVHKYYFSSLSTDGRSLLDVISFNIYPQMSVMVPCNIVMWHRYPMRCGIIRVIPIAVRRRFVEYRSEIYRSKIFKKKLKKLQRNFNITEVIKYQ